jgi:hypothetical protein
MTTIEAYCVQNVPNGTLPDAGRTSPNETVSICRWRREQEGAIREKHSSHPQGPPQVAGPTRKGSGLITRVRATQAIQKGIAPGWLSANPGSFRNNGGSLIPIQRPVSGARVWMTVDNGGNPSLSMLFGSARRASDTRPCGRTRRGDRSKSAWGCRIEIFGTRPTSQSHSVANPRRGVASLAAAAASPETAESSPAGVRRSDC